MISYGFFFFMFFFFFIFCIFLLLAIAFLTLFERHLLGMSQIRKAPNKVSVLGVFQAFFDGLKLFKKEVFIIYFSSKYYFFLVPFVMFFIMFLEWMVLPYFFFFFNFEMSYLFFLCLVGFLVYMMLLTGIYSKSKYSMLGAIRSSSQSISFEVVFFFFLYCFMLFSQSFMIICFFNFFSLILFPLFLIMVLVELNRAPFDFSEGESELVSGYNLEMGGFLFVLLFLSEYGFLLFFSVLLSFMFFNNYLIFMVFILFLMLLVRSSFPRYRYDKLMFLFWVILLPLVMFFFLVFYILFIVF